MIKISNIKFTPDEVSNLRNLALIQDSLELKSLISNKFLLPIEDIYYVKILKESIDSRNQTTFVYTFAIELSNKKSENSFINRHKNSELIDDSAIRKEYIDFNNIKLKIKNDIHQRPIVVGFGPAGMFAALKLALQGKCPIVIERGSCVEERIKDINNFTYNKVLNEDSNIQFGEGGAGTFSDGKLSTGVKSDKTTFILETLVKCGAPEDILYKAQPHVGTDNLRRVIVNFRNLLQSLGAEIKFNTKLIDIIVINNNINAIRVNTSDNIYEILTNNVIICIGHSARDTIKMLYNKGLLMAQKPFAIGLRIEHLQEDINRARYHNLYKLPSLPAASYNINTTTPDGRGLYSFCMCPGGEVVLASSTKNTIVINGMSNYLRNGSNANSAILVGVKTSDFINSVPLSGLEFQNKLEQKAFEINNSEYRVPVQTVGNFLGKTKTNLIEKVKPSCKAGYRLSNLNEFLPNFIVENIKYGLPRLANKISCFADNSSILSGIETRSSSPVRIIRSENGQTNIKGLFGAGEGSGFAGGIVSAAIDGIKIAEFLIDYMGETNE